MNILVVAPYFAPSSEVASARMISLTSHLVNNGHHVSVVCWSKKKLLTIYDDKELSSSVPEGVDVIPLNFKSIGIPIIDDIVYGIRLKHFLSFSVDIKSYDLVFVTCGPYFSLEALPLLKKKYKTKIIIDFRDLGALNYRPSLGSETSKPAVSKLKKSVINCYQWFVSRREKRAVTIADAIICVSKIDKEKMQTYYDIQDDNIIVASNGFDDNKLIDIKPCEKESGIVGAVFGKFMYYSRKRALALLIAIDKQRENGVNIKLRHIGRNYDFIDEAISSNHINPASFENIGLKEYREGMSILGASDFFVVEDTSPDDVGTKIYDYIFWNKPIIAAVPKNIPLAKLVSSFKHGYVCETEREIEQAINEIVANGYSFLDPDIDISAYSRSFQNDKIEELFIKVVLRR